jgi:NADPH:quinone reductase-like Zn-dependent oxidoreductase
MYVFVKVAPLQQEFEAKLSAAKGRAKQQCVNGCAALLRRMLTAVDALAAEIADATAVVGAPVRLSHPCAQAKIILVTAASGFVGSHVLVMLVSLGYTVRGVMDRKQWLAPSSSRYVIAPSSSSM